jgi:hypothetical protein
VRIISRMVVGSADVTREQADRIFERKLKRVSRKFTHMRYHSFRMYFGVPKRLEWVEPIEKTEPSAIKDSYPAVPERVYYRPTKVSIQLAKNSSQMPCSCYTLKPALAT